MKFLTAAFLTAGLIVLLNCCNDAPSEAGTILVHDSVNATSISSNIDTILTKSLSVVTRIPNLNTGALYIGKTQNAAAATLLRLENIPDTLGWLSDVSLIDSATMYIQPQRFVLGDSSVTSNLLSFNVVALKKAWLSQDTTGSISVVPHWNDLFTSGVTPSPDYFASTPIGTYSGQIALTDSANISLPLNTDGKQLLSSWFAMHPDSTLRKQIYGIGLVPNATSTVIREFSTQSIFNASLVYIRIHVYYHTSANVRDSLLLHSGNDASFVDSDTLSSPYLLAQSLVQSEGRLFFDVTKIPALNAILKAQLVLTLDTTKTVLGNIALDSRLNLTSSVYNAADTGTVPGPSFSSGRVPGSDKVIFSNVSTALDYARRRNGGRGYFSILSAGSNMERHAIYSLASPLALRPQLVVTYIARPNVGGIKK